MLIMCLTEVRRMVQLDHCFFFNMPVLVVCLFVCLLVRFIFLCIRILYLGCCFHTGIPYHELNNYY